MIVSLLLCVCLCTVGARAHVPQHAGYGSQHRYSRQYPQTESVQTQHVHQLLRTQVKRALFMDITAEHALQRPTAS